MRLIDLIDICGVWGVACNQSDSLHRQQASRRVVVRRVIFRKSVD